MPVADPVIDQRMMERCLLLALQAEGRTSPNPMVGALVLDKHGEIVGEGFHARAGQPHAEVFAIEMAAEKARDGVLYVTLEPCCHFGKTPPCSKLVRESGVRRVVIGLGDPNPKVAGGGIRELRECGVEVELGVLEDECRWINRGFLSRITRKRPWVNLKIASTLDGRIADRERNSRWITGEQARNYVHELRNKVDCMLIGTETVLRDNPRLNVRQISNSRNPHKALIDSAFKIPFSAKLFQSEGEEKLFVFHNEETAIPAGIPPGVECVATKAQGEKSHIDLDQVLRELAARGVNTILCEGGGRLAAALLQRKLVDEVHWIVAPKIICDSAAVAAVDSDQAIELRNALTLSRVRTSALGDDSLIHGILTDI